MTKTVANGLRIGMAIDTADPVANENSKDCIVSSHGLESASTTGDHDARPNTKGVHWE